MKPVAGRLYPAPRGPFVEIVTAGRPQAELVLAAQPTRLERYAAAELQAYLRKISGATLPVRREGRGGGRPFAIFIGATRRAAALAAGGERVLGRDGFVLQSVRHGLVVKGRDELGTLFGVYELLERYFDVRWFMPGDLGEHVPPRATLRLGRIRLVFKPAFRVRWVGAGEWPLRQRMNAYVTAGGREVGIRWKWHFHTFRILIPPEKYYRKHPEYFALVNGKRTVTDDPKQGNQLCTSNPDVIREVGRNLNAALDAEPGIEIITLSPNDGGGFCECPACRALDEPRRDWFARYSRRLALFNNAVARIVRQKHPRVLIKVGAYAMYARPPRDKAWRPEPNLFFQLCHLYFCHSHPLTGNRCRAGVTYQTGRSAFQTNREFRKILDQWLKLSPHLFIYEYYALDGMKRAGLPWPLAHTILKDIRYYRDRGVEGFYTQLDPNLWHRLGLNYYLAAKLCWNADLDPAALLDDYCAKFYGPAAAPMRAYLLGMERAVEDWNGCLSYGLQPPDGEAFKALWPKVFTPAVMARLGQNLEQAERLAGGAPFAPRVALARRMYLETQQVLATVRKDGA